MADPVIQSVTMADCVSLVELANSFGFQLLVITGLFSLAVGFFLGRSFLTDRSPVFDVRLKTYGELIEDDEKCK